MKYETIADIYTANKIARENLQALISAISDEEAAELSEGETWTIQKIVEHLSMVDFGISRICSKLLEEAKATAKPSDGTVSLSPTFREKLALVGSVKVEAPERVQPTGNVSIAEALDRMEANRPAIDAMRTDLEKYDLSVSKFPHPYFGDITAAEWLIVAGGHEMRHTAQIERSLAKIRG
jgi:hypothetical protein